MNLRGLAPLGWETPSALNRRLQKSKRSDIGVDALPSVVKIQSAGEPDRTCLLKITRQYSSQDATIRKKYASVSWRQSYTFQSNSLSPWMAARLFLFCDWASDGRNHQ
jgi:hypothetical protein